MGGVAGHATGIRSMISGGKKVSKYHQLSNAEKQAHARTAMREPAVVCPSCETQTTVADLLRHAETCAGPRAPHPRSKWITWKQAMEMGVAKPTLSRWVNRGLVRTRVKVSREVNGPGRPAQRIYLERDIVRRVGFRRRISSTDGTNRRTTRED
jgi:hypothetical protein